MRILFTRALAQGAYWSKSSKARSFGEKAALTANPLRTNARRALAAVTASAGTFKSSMHSGQSVPASTCATVSRSET